jgi:hypothetical protein
VPYDQDGNWYDDGTDLPPDGGGGFGYDMSTLYNSPYMQTGMPGQNFSTAKFNFGTPLPVGQNVYNQILTGTKNLNQLQTNPSVLYNAQVATGQQTMDPNALMGLDATGSPYLGGGGGGGGGNGYNPNFTTSLLDSLATSAPGTPGNLIYTGIKTKKSPIDIKLGFRDNGTYDTDTLKVLDQQVDDAFNEYSLAQRNAVAGANQPAQATPIQEWMNKNGLINPMDTYSGETLPGDVDVTGAAMRAVAPNLRMAEDAGIANRANSLRTDSLTGQLNAAKSGQYGADADVVSRFLSQPRSAPQAPAYDPTTQGAGALQEGGLYTNPGNGTAALFTPNAAPQQGASPRQQTAYGRNAPTSTGNPAVKQAMMRMITHAMGVGGNQTTKQRQLAQQQTAARRDADRDAAYQRQYQERAKNSPANIRELAARDLAAQGRTPARDAQRTILRYMQQGGLG